MVNSWIALGSIWMETHRLLGARGAESLTTNATFLVGFLHDVDCSLMYPQNPSLVMAHVVFPLGTSFVSIIFHGLNGPS